MVWKQISQWAALSALLVVALPAVGATSLSSADFTRLSSATANDKLGKSIATGDINGDGYADLVMGAPNNTTAYIAIGYGSENLPTDATVSTSNSTIITGNGSSDSFGGNVVVGDVNGDGYDDVAVSATGDTTGGGTNSGAVYLFYGQSSQLTSGAAASNTDYARFIGAGAGFLSGSGLAMGDLDNDGFTDLLVGSTNDIPNNGAVAIIYGQTTKYTGTSNNLNTYPKFTGSSGSNFGAPIATGDANGDGYDDVLIGAIQNSDGAPAGGAAFLFYGQSTDFTSATNVSTAAEWTGELANDTAGAAVAMGDVDGDGYDDLLIAASGSDAGDSNAGAVYLVNGSGTQFSAGARSLSTATEFTGVTASDAVNKVAAIDTDNDGSKEIVVGAASASSGAGVVYILPGTASAGSLSTGATITGTDTEALGAALGSGDLNGNGIQELLFGASNYNSNAGSVLMASLYGVEIDGDGIDNDSDGEVDEHNTGTHPYYSTASVTDADTAADSISSVSGAAAGVISVTYADNSIYDYTVFTTTTSKATLVRQYPNTGYAVVLHRKGKKIKLVNLYTGETANTKTLRERSVSSARFLLKDLRDDNKTEAVVTLVKPSKAFVYVVKVKKNSGRLSVADQETVQSSRVAANKTKAKTAKVILRTSASRVIATFSVNNSYELVAQ